MKAFNTSYSSLIGIAFPLSLGAFAQFLVVLTDNYYLSKVSTVSINAAGNGGMLYLTAIMLGVGLASGVQIFISRKQGEGVLEETGAWFGTGMRTALVMALLLYGAYRYVDFRYLNGWYSDPELLATMREFMGVRFIGLFVYLPLLILNSFYIGIARTLMLSVAMVLTSSVNVVLNYLLIFGNHGFPEMGVEGAAIASLSAEATGLVFMILYTLTRKGNAPYKLWSGLFTKVQGFSRRLLKISAPLMLQQTMGMGVWTVFYVLVARVGAEELKVSHIVRNTYMLAFVCIMGFAFTTRTVVSTLIAEKRQEELWGVMRKLMLLNFAGVFLLCNGLIFFPYTIASLFYEENEISSISMLVKTFGVVFPAVLFFSITSILFNSIEGAGRTRIGLGIEIISIALYITGVYQVTVAHPQPIHIIWMTEFIYFGSMGFFALLYLRFSNWKYTTI